MLPENESGSVSAWPDTVSSSVPGVFERVRALQVRASAQNRSVESGAPMFWLKVSEAELLMAWTGPTKSVSDASSVTVRGVAPLLTMLDEDSCSWLMAPNARLRQRDLDERRADRLIDQQEIVGAAAEIAAQLTVETSERRPARIDGQLQPRFSCACLAQR